MRRLPPLFIATALLLMNTHSTTAEEKRPHIKIRGIYGGVPTELLDHGELVDYGVNAIFMGSGGLNAERISLLRKQGAKVFAEFNTMHVAYSMNTRTHGCSGAAMCLPIGSASFARSSMRLARRPCSERSTARGPVSVDQVRDVMDHGTRLPATGVMVFNWGSLKKQMAKVDQMAEYYRGIRE